MMRRGICCARVLLGLFVCWALPAAAQTRTLADVPRLLKTARYRFLPLPIVASDPAEGQTYGALPVVVALDANEDVTSIFAAAFTYNSVTKAGGFGIGLFTPSPAEELRLFGGASQRFYREASADYFNRRLLAGRFRLEGHFLYLEDPFERFFGFGPDTPKVAESNFTSHLLRGWGEVSYEFRPHLAALTQLEWSRLRLQPRAISTLLDTVTAYGGDPEVQGSDQILYRAGLRWDSQDNEFFPTRGIQASAVGLLSHATRGSKTFFGGYELRCKFAWQPRRRWTTVGSGRWQQLFGRRIPFTLQSSLGGEKELRGFVPRRFADRHAVVLNLEERILVKEWPIMGTKVALSIDPFFSIGQVFHRLDDLRPRHWEPAGGIGFRMRAAPAVLGRVDVAYGRDGVAVYTTLDYPF